MGADGLSPTDMALAGTIGVETFKPPMVCAGCINNHFREENGGNVIGSAKFELLAPGGNIARLQE